MNKIEESESSEHVHTFEEFEKSLASLRQSGHDILKMVERENNSATRKLNYETCVKNFKHRTDLLDNFNQKLKEEQAILKYFIDKNENDIEKKVEVMQEMNKLKKVELFLLLVKAEIEREQFYKTTAMEKYMANYLEISTNASPESS